MTAKRPEEAFDETPETPADSQQEESRSEATADAEPEAADDVADEGADTGLAELQAKAAENWDRYLRAVARPRQHRSTRSAIGPIRGEPLSPADIIAGMFTADPIRLGVLRTHGYRGDGRGSPLRRTTRYT